MFEYAFIISSQKEKRPLFFLEKEGVPIELYSYFRLQKNLFYFADVLFFNHRNFRLFFSHYLRGYFYRTIRKIFIKENISISDTEEPHNVLKQLNGHGGKFYTGYFQSYLYFENNLAEVLQSFRLKRKIVRHYHKAYPFPEQKKRVTIHIRRTDYTELKHLDLGGSDLTLPFAYYHQLLEKIHVDNHYYTFISDEPALIAREFNYINEKHISNDSAIVDFQHMLNSDICIIANSTFSWWAAYLNQNPKKIVYCPKHFLGFRVKKEYPINIYPPEWIQVDVP